MSLLLALALLAAPASQPTSQPSPPRPDEKVITDAKQRFHFAVPKQWKEVPQQVESIYVFQFPATGEGRRLVPSLIVTAKPLADQPLSHEVDARRESIKSKNARAKFSEDAAATVAGHEGWTFSYDTELNQTVTNTSNGKSHQEKVAIKVRDQMTLIDGRVFEFILTSDEKGVPIRTRLTDRVISTLVVDPTK